MAFQIIVPNSNVCKTLDMSSKPTKRSASAISTSDNGTTSKKQKTTDYDESCSFIDTTLGTEMVDIYVGANEKLFRVHKKMLCDKVPYFDKMFNGGFNEATTSTAKFPDDEERCFDILMEWVYTDILRYIGNGFQMNKSVILIYVLADKFCLQLLMDQIMDKWISRLKSSLLFCGPGLIGFGYSNTLQGSAPRKFLSRSLHYILQEKRRSSYFKDWPTARVAELLKANDDLSIDLLALIRKHPPGTRVEDPRLLPACEYHSHEKGASCAAGV